MKEINTSILKSTFFTVGFSWFNRLIGMVSMIILARLLSPDDFGIVGIAYLAVNFARVFLDFGVQVALIKIKDTEQNHFDTAWTIRIIQTSIITCILLVSSPFIAEYFQENRAKFVLYYLAFIPLLNGLQNIGVINFQKKMQFVAEFYFLCTQRITGFIITILSAFILRSYWALVVGSLATEISGLILSYIVHPMRPRLSLTKSKDIFFISQWMLVKNIGTYLQDNLHNFFVGRWSSTSVLGAYSLAGEISRMPSTELLAPFNRVLFPAFSKVQNNLKELKKVFLLAQGVQILIAVPASVGLALVANEAVLLFLGNKWNEAVPFVQILALTGVLHAITSTSGYIMIVLGNIRLHTLISVAQVFIFLIIIVILQVIDAQKIALVYLTVTACGVLINFFALIKIFPTLLLSELIKNLVVPIFGTIAMTLNIILITPYFEYSNIFSLLFKILLGVTTYFLFIIINLIVFKRDNSAEMYIINKIQFFINKI